MSATEARDGRAADAADVAVVGAGAAGLATAIFLRQLDPTVRVTVLDGARRPGAKIVVSGGGRCNVTNAVVTERDFWGGPRPIVRRVLRALPVPETVAFFSAIGVPLHEEAGGKLFPDSHRSRDVSDALLRELERVGGRLDAPRRATSLAREEDRFRIETSTGPLTAARVVLATGGLSLPKTGSDGSGYGLARSLGHTLVPTTPALAPLVLDGTDLAHSTLSGVSLDVVVTVWIDGSAAERLAGSLLWTHFGASGPVVLNASRHWERAVLEGRRVALTLNLLGEPAFDAVDVRLLALAADRPKSSLHGALAGLIPASVGEALLHAMRLSTDTALSQLTREDRRRLAHALTAWPLRVTGSRGYNFAEATAGGIPLDEMHAATMESRVCPGLFLVGEVLDVDGRIGGFNFQWAWASARAAAAALAKRPVQR